MILSHRFRQYLRAIIGRRRLPVCIDFKKGCKVGYVIVGYVIIISSAGSRIFICRSSNFILSIISQQQSQNNVLRPCRSTFLGYEQMNISDGRRGRLRHAEMVDGDVTGSKGMGGKVVVMIDK